MISTELPEEYVLQKFYEHAGYPKHKKITNVHEAGCPICQEGHSWGKKRRSYYIPKEHVICCHNCGWYSTPRKWIQHVTRMSYEEIDYELQTGDFRYIDMSPKSTSSMIVNTVVESLPKDSINMFDTQQLRYYSNSQVVKKCLDLIASRRLDTAVNRPKSLYLSLTDPVHKNRLCIPFYDTSGDIAHYQTRGFMPKDLEERPKYLSKINSNKTLFNINNVSVDAEEIYIFEGPIDSFFMKNSVATAGIQESSESVFTSRQRHMINTRPFAKHVWILDNQWSDQASRNKTKLLIEQGFSVFIWPKNFRQFKDFNDLAINYKLDVVSPTFVRRNTYTGMTARLMLSKIK